LVDLKTAGQRMLCSYFGSKEGLYLAVPERASARIRSLKNRLHLESREPEAAMRKMPPRVGNYRLETN